ncbi:MAG: hypothetical protein E2O50_03290 [Gammaproteobacteria bacterium]|nr:MAG: hypothetical protein E2O50_03290 [Gammaproteobacteria bacterium]
MTVSKKQLRFLLITAIAAGTTFMGGCATTSTSAEPEVDEVAVGREQMIRAFDAAWVRVIASGKDREILATEPAADPGAANGYIVRMADCLPLPDLTPYPEAPVGLLKKVLDSGQIRRLIQDVPTTPGSTTDYFSGISSRYFEAILEEISSHYGVDIEYTNVGYPPGRLASTTALLDDKVDFLSQLNAAGGRTQNLRRRISRRFSCTMIASSQFIQIPQDSPLVSEIKSLNDLMDRPDIRICAGPLSTQTIKAFMPNHMVMTRYIDDIADCDDKISRGKADIMVNPLPDLGIAGFDQYISVPTLIVAGTPLWVAQEGIACDVEPASGRGAMDCREINPL